MKPNRKRARIGFELLEDRVSPATFWVVNTQDNSVGGFDGATQRNQGSLRWAIAQTNADTTDDNGGSPDEIQFDIPGPGPFNIVLNTTLPDLTITNPVAILGETQQPNSPLPSVSIDGNGRAYGFVVQGTNTATIDSLMVGNCSTAEILVENSTNTQVTRNLIGINLANKVSGGAAGIQIIGSSNVTIGSPTGRNVISGNTANVLLQSSSNNFICSNYIGTTVDGTATAGNSTFGIQIDDQSSSNKIGGIAYTPGTGLGNVIANATIANIGIYNSSNINQIYGNLIGLDKAGKTKLGDTSYGVLIQPGLIANTNAGKFPQGNIIGGTDVTDRNVISGARVAGIIIGNDNAGKYDTVVQSNYIGTDINGTNAIPNGYSIMINGDGNTIGGANPLGLPDGMGLSPGNVISGNTSGGIQISGSPVNTFPRWYAANNVIQGNIIGADVTSNNKLGSQNRGILMLRTENTQIGGTAPGAGNAISGNNIGIDMKTSQGSTTIQGNLIGTNKQGLAGQGKLGNSVGILGVSVGGLIIGGNSNGAAPPGNIISGNASDGINLASDDSGSSSVLPTTLLPFLAE